jgi:hypothetical protein
VLRQSRKNKSNLARGTTSTNASARVAKENFRNAAIAFFLTELDVAVTFLEVCQERITSSSKGTEIDHQVRNVERALLGALRAKARVLAESR